MWIVVGLLVGVFAGLMTNLYIPPEFSQYLAVAILACLDSVFGAVVAHMQKTFDTNIFLTGFFSNALIAAVLTFIGSLIGVDMGLAATIVFGTRMLNNAASIRRLWFSIRRAKKAEKENNEENL